MRKRTRSRTPKENDGHSNKRPDSLINWKSSGEIATSVSKRSPGPGKRTRLRTALLTHRSAWNQIQWRLWRGHRRSRGITLNWWNCCCQTCKTGGNCWRAAHGRGFFCNTEHQRPRETPLAWRLSMSLMELPNPTFLLLAKSTNGQLSGRMSIRPRRPQPRQHGAWAGVGYRSWWRLQTRLVRSSQQNSSSSGTLGRARSRTSSRQLLLCCCAKLTAMPQ